MKKLIVILLVFVFAFCSALAEGLDEPALKNPQERYEMYTEETDGSETVLYIMLDAQNDEAADVEEYGCLRSINTFVGPDGREGMSTYTLLQNSEFGRVMINSITPEPLFGATYSIGMHNYTSMFGSAERIEDVFYSTEEEFNWYWEAFHFPYGSLEVLNGVRQDENGNTYFLVKSNDGISFEFATGESMSVDEIRVYQKNENGDLALISLVHFETCDAVQIPESVLELMREDFAQ